MINLYINYIFYFLTFFSFFLVKHNLIIINSFTKISARSYYIFLKNIFGLGFLISIFSNTSFIAYCDTSKKIIKKSFEAIKPTDSPKRGWHTSIAKSICSKQDCKNISINCQEKDCEIKSCIIGHFSSTLEKHTTKKIEKEDNSIHIFTYKSNFSGKKNGDTYLDQKIILLKFEQEINSRIYKLNDDATKHLNSNLYHFAKTLEKQHLKKFLIKKDDNNNDISNNNNISNNNDSNNNDTPIS